MPINIENINKAQLIHELIKNVYNKSESSKEMLAQSEQAMPSLAEIKARLRQNRAHFIGCIGCVVLYMDFSKSSIDPTLYDEIHRTGTEGIETVMQIIENIKKAMPFIVYHRPHLAPCKEMDPSLYQPTPFATTTMPNVLCKNAAIKTITFCFYGFLESQIRQTLGFLMRTDSRRNEKYLIISWDDKTQNIFLGDLPSTCTLHFYEEEFFPRALLAAESKSTVEQPSAAFSTVFHPLKSESEQKASATPSSSEPLKTCTIM